MNQLSVTIKRHVAAGADPAINGNPRAFAIICACSVWPRESVDIARIRRLLAPGHDVGLLRAVAHRHGVAALVADGLRAADVAVPPGIDRIARARAGAALAQLRDTIALDRLLADAGVAMLTLKGVALAQRLHGGVALRESADIDIAVAPDQVDRAWVALAAAGYVRERPAAWLPPPVLRRYLRVTKDSLHRRGADGTIVELHWRLSDESADAAIPREADWQRQAITPGLTLRTLGDDALFAYLCVHGAAHLWARLKWLADVATLVRAAPDHGSAWWDAARTRGDGRAVASALLLAHEFLAMPLPAGFVPPRSMRLRLLVALARRVLRAGGGARELATTRWRGWAEFAAKLLVAPNGRVRARVIARLLVSGDDIADVPLPPLLVPFYVLLRVPLLLRRRRARYRARLSATHGRSASS